MTWIALLPFLVVIPISILTRQVIPGLFIGLLTGSYLINPTLLGGIKESLSYLIINLTTKNNIQIIIFLYIFSGLINMIKLTGGIKGFVHLASKKIKTKKGALLLIWLSILGTFSAPNLRVITVAPIMKALKEKVNLSSEKIALVIDTTSAPVVAIIPIATAFVGYMVSVIEIPLKELGISTNPYSIYIKSIPFNFFSLVLILMGLYFSFFKTDTDNKITTKEKDKSLNEKCLEKCYQAYEKKTPIKPWNLILPLTTILVLTIFLNIFINNDVLGAMLQAILITFILAIIFFSLQGFSIKELFTNFIEGGNELMGVIVLLALIWGVTNVSKDLGFSEYIINNIGNKIPTYFIAPVLFILGAIISYFIGSSWGTWGLLMPLGITLATTSDTNILLAIGAVFSSGIFGSFASPLSDNANTLAAILDISIIQYSSYKLIPALIAAGITTLLFIIASFMMS